MKEHDWEKLLKIKTTGRDDSRAGVFRYPYEPTEYEVLEKLAYAELGHAELTHTELTHAELTHADLEHVKLISKKNTLLDYGCGKGRVAFFLAYQTKCHVIGIEYDDRLYNAAMANRERAVSGERTDFVCMDAKEYTVPAEVYRAFFFNPFSVEILRSVLERIFESYYEQPREMLLFFYYPSDEYVSCLMQESRLSFVDEIMCGAGNGAAAGGESTVGGGAKGRERILIFEVG